METSPDPPAPLAPPVQTRVQALPYVGISWDHFEGLCQRLASTEADIEQTRRYGVQGDDQAGIDLYAHLGEGRYATYQCKNVAGFGPAKITAAIDAFIAGEWFGRSDRFVLCTRENLASQRRSDALEQGRARLGAVALVVWDAGELDARLKDHPRIVDDFFSRAWVAAFNGPETATALGRDDQTRASRLAEPDAALDGARQDDSLPNALLDLLAQPVLEDLSALLAAGDAQEAFALASRRSREIDAALADAGEDAARTLRSYRQRLLFAAGTSASWLGDLADARARCRRALALGPVAPEHLSQATTALFNASLPDDLRRLVCTISAEDPARALADGLLAYLEGDWETVTERLPESDSSDVLMMRAQARIALLDLSNADAVGEAAMLLDAAETHQTLASGALLAARVTTDLFLAVLDGEAPLAFDRQPLADAVRRRALAALDATDPGTPLRARAVGVLSQAAGVLADDALGERAETEAEALPDEVRAEAFVSMDPLPTRGDVERLRLDGLIDEVQAVRITAAIHEAAGDVGAADTVLREALFASSDARQRALLLRLLVQVLRRNGRTAAADALVDATPISDAERWTLRTQATHGVPDLDEAAAFPLHVGAVRLVAARLTSAALARISDDRRGDQADSPPWDDGALDPTVWTGRLVRLLPSHSSRRMHADALSLARQYDALLVVLEGLDVDERTAKLRAHALHGLGRTAEAADSLTRFARAHPQSLRAAAHAAELLSQDGRPGAAIDLLAPLADADDVGVLVALARALIVQAPDDRQTASRAFDLLARAYDARASADIAAEAWRAARGADREAEAGRFFRAYVDGAPQIEATEDLDAAFQASTNRVVRIVGDADALADVLRRDTDRSAALDRVLGAHGIAYADAFGAGGRAWQTWTRWTRHAARAGGGDGYAVLADWPSSAFSHVRRQPGGAPGLFADATALLTLGLLGPVVTASLLDAVGTLHVAAGTLDGLLSDRLQIEADILIAGASRASAAVAFLRQHAGAVVAYSPEVEDAAPDDDTLGAVRIDLGAASLLNAPYVSALDSVAATEHNRISPRTLLATLVADGFVTADGATAAEAARPGTFEGWQDETPLAVLPDAIVFDPFALLDVVSANLLDALGARVRVGPWGWAYLSDQADRHDASTAAYDRLGGLVDTLRPRAVDGRLVELEPVREQSRTAASPVGRGDADASPSERLETVWARALVSMRTARRHGLQLWADDRFYALLLWQGGPTFEGPETDRLRASLAGWAARLPPIPTVELLGRLASERRLPLDTATSAAAALFDAGYRPIHSLVLAHAVTAFPPPDARPLRGRYRQIVDAVEAVPSYLSTDIEDERRHGLARICAAEVSEDLVSAAWTVPSLADSQRRVLADALVDAVERVFHAHSADLQARRADRTRLLFWKGISNTLQSLPVSSPGTEAHRDAAMTWLGDAVVRRAADLTDLVRYLEDSVIDAARFVASDGFLARRGDVKPEQIPRIAGRFALTAMLPLVQAGHVDPLLRRTVGLLARLVRGGRADITGSYGHGDGRVSVTIHEEEHDEVAADLLRRAVHGDAELGAFVAGTALDFGYYTPAPPGWIEAGVAANTKIPVDVKTPLFALLWADPPDLRELLVRLLALSLATLDPDLALRLRAAEPNLLGDDDARREAARDRLALDVLLSVYLDLQRDLGHAVARLRDAPAETLARFVGWVGETDAQALADVRAPVVAIGAALVPQGHAHARALLTDAYDDALAVRDVVQAAPTEDVAVWLSTCARIAETSNDPATAAWAFRHVLVALGESPGLAQAALTDSRGAAGGWVARYLTTALSSLDGDLGRHMSTRRRLATAAFRLATLACFGPHHVAAYEAEPDSLAEALDRVWMLQSKLVAVLPDLSGGAGQAVDDAEQAVRDFGLDSPTTYALDAFDPFAFGETPSGTEDVGHVLTLAALLRAFPGDGLPVWWTDEVERLVAARAAGASPAPEPQGDETVGDRFGIGVRLRTRPLADHLLDRVRHARGS